MHLFSKKIILTIISTIMFTACGQELDKPLQVELLLPEEIGSELFWSGVTKKQVTKLSKNKTETIIFPESGLVALEASEGDWLIFEGLNESGRTLVRGESMVLKEKEIKIRLQRVLH